MKSYSIFTRSIALGAFAFALGIGAPAQAKVSGFDADGDEYVDMEEFRKGTAASFRSEDTDQDNRLSREEFNARFNDANNDFDEFDTNNDGYLNNDEFDRGIYSRYDQDGDGRLDVNEGTVFDETVGDYTRPRDPDTIIEDTDKLNIKAN